MEASRIGGGSTFRLVWSKRVLEGGLEVVGVSITAEA